MGVVNIPAGTNFQLPAGAVPGLMHAYCVGPGPATFGISIMNPAPPYVWHNPSAGHMVTFQVDGLAVWLTNNGPSRLQVLYQ